MKKIIFLDFDGVLNAENGQYPPTQNGDIRSLFKLFTLLAMQMYHIVSQLWTKLIIRSDHKSDDTCLMVDDTDFPKRGRRMENIGRVHSHLEYRSI